MKTTSGHPAGREDVGDATDRERRARLHRAADLLLRHPFQGWFYGDSIGFEGLVAASGLLGDPRYRSFGHGFLRGWATRARPFREMDNTIAGRTLAVLAAEEGDAVLSDAARAVADWSRERPTIGGVHVSFSKAPLREPYGGGTLSADEARLLEDPGPGVYVDCLHFDPPFFVSLGARIGDGGLIDAGAGQALGYVRLLQDEATGLFRHFWLERTGRAYVLGWSRGQGWALLGLLDVLEDLPADHEARAGLTVSIRRLVDALAATQRPDGHWSAVAHEPASGHEASTAAFVAAGIRRGVDLGILAASDLPVGARAWQATIRSLDERGVLADVSAAVWSSTSQTHYHHVPTGFVVPWGQGPLLVAASLWLPALSPE